MAAGFVCWLTKRGRFQNHGSKTSQDLLAVHVAARASAHLVSVFVFIGGLLKCFAGWVEFVSLFVYCFRCICLSFFLPSFHFFLFRRLLCIAFLERPLKLQRRSAALAINV